MLDVITKPIEDMTMEELEELEASLKSRMAEKRVARRQEAIKALEETACAHGFKLMELIGPTPRRVKRPARMVLYVSPEDPSRTWTGRGRRPQWIKDFVEVGGDLETLKA